jgi:hypothetical protein
MIIQQNDCYKLEVKIQWLDAEQVHVKIVTHNLEKTGWVQATHNYFMKPEELAKMSDYIDSTLAR